MIPSKIYANSIKLIGKSINIILEGRTTPMKKIKAKMERVEGKTNEEEEGGKLFAKINNVENKSNYIPLGTFVRVNYPVGNFKNIFKLPETSLYGENIYFVEDGIAKQKKVNLLYKGSGFILVDGNISEKDLIITTRMPDNLNNQKVTILN